MSDLVGNPEDRFSRVAAHICEFQGDLTQTGVYNQRKRQNAEISVTIWSTNDTISIQSSVNFEPCRGTIIHVLMFLAKTEPLSCNPSVLLQLQYL